VTLLDRHGRELMPVPQRALEVQEQKAVTGFGVTALTYSPHLWTLQATPQKKAWGAAALYSTHDGIRKAESSVSDTGGSVPWHLEDAEGDTVEDDSAAEYLAVRDLLEKPQAGLALEDRQPGLGTFRALLTTTLRHMGLCGTTFWYLDQTEALGGTPLAILYIAPWRLFEVRDVRTGRFLGWTLDGPMDQGGVPVERTNLLPFYLHPPDQGNFASGLVEACAGKVPLAGLIDRHVAKVVASGGRLAGLLSPKVGSVVTEDNWQQFVRDYRGITQSDDAALKLQIVQGPVDFVKTAADMHELAIVEIDARTDAAIRELWHLPGSQTGATAPAGLNSGNTKSFDEAVLWQKAIHPRLVAVYETIQYELLDRYKKIGTTVELVFDEPEFDDDTPRFDKALKASQAGIALTVAERRELIGKDPFGEKILDERGRQVDLLVFTPMGQTEAFYASEKLPEPEPEPIMVPPPEPPAPEPPPEVKAALPDRLERLRRQVDRTAVSQVKRTVQDVLQAQKAGIVRYLQTVGLDHLRRTKGEFRWSAKGADATLEGALRPVLGRIVQRVAARTHAALSTGKAVMSPLDEFTEAVLNRVLTRGAGRVRGINQTTRDAVQQAIADSIEDATTISDVIAAVEGLPVFSELRAETIARTESMFAYNDAALGSYQEMGVEMVEAVDGDEDTECAERNGQVFTVEEASSIEDHPNGTLDWIPLIPDEPPQKADLLPGGLVLLRDPATGRIVQVAPTPQKAEPVSMRFLRSENGRLSGMSDAASLVAFERDDEGRLSGVRVERVQ